MFMEKFENVDEAVTYVTPDEPSPVTEQDDDSIESVSEVKSDG